MANCLSQVKARGQFILHLRGGEVGTGRVEFAGTFRFDLREALVFFIDDGLDVIGGGLEVFGIVGIKVAVGVLEVHFARGDGAVEGGFGGAAHAERGEEVVHGVLGELQGFDDVWRGFGAVDGRGPVHPNPVGVGVDVPGELTPGVEVDAVADVGEFGVIGLAGGAGEKAHAAIMPEQAEALFDGPIGVIDGGGGEVEAAGGLAGDLVFGDLGVGFFMAEQRRERRGGLAIRCA